MASVTTAARPDELARILAHDRRHAAARALRAISELEGQLARARNAIEQAEAGTPVVSTHFTPSHQTLNEVQELGAEYRALWTTSGYLER